VALSESDGVALFAGNDRSSADNITAGIMFFFNGTVFLISLTLQRYKTFLNRRDGLKIIGAGYRAYHKDGIKRQKKPFNLSSI
jgi:hypothetical protein